MVRLLYPDSRSGAELAAEDSTQSALLSSGRDQVENLEIQYLDHSFFCSSVPLNCIPPRISEGPS